MRFANITLLRDYIYVSGGRRYYVLHGDVFDHVTSSMRWLAKVGDVGYSLLMWFNRRPRRGARGSSAATSTRPTNAWWATSSTSILATGLNR